MSDAEGEDSSAQPEQDSSHVEEHTTGKVKISDSLPEEIKDEPVTEKADEEKLRVESETTQQHSTEKGVDVEDDKKASQQTVGQETEKEEHAFVSLQDQQKESKMLPIEDENTFAPEQDEAKHLDVRLASSESLGKKHGRGSWKEDKELRKSRTDRLSSKARNVVGSTISIHRLSAIGEFFDRSKGARYMNTYKLDSDNPFNPDKVRKILESVMVEALENLTYDPDKCPKQAKWASSAIRAKVKELQFDRYKLICLVTIGEKNSQDVFVTCRFLWDVDRDRYATYTVENTYVFGIAQCFGVYYE